MKHRRSSLSPRVADRSGNIENGAVEAAEDAKEECHYVRELT